MTFPMAQMAAQLRRPEGEQAAETGRRMNEANRGLNERCIDALALRPGQRVLEIGPGNAAFAGRIVAAADGVHYTGLDWSGEMVAEAARLHAALVDSGRADFVQGSSERLPFAHGRFDHVLSVHTLYFWAQPPEHLAEIRRVLRPGGWLCLAFGDRAFMQGLPFTAHGFALPGLAEVQAWLAGAGFEDVAVQTLRETGPSNTGQVVDKVFHVARGRAP